MFGLQVEDGLFRVWGRRLWFRFLAGRFRAYDLWL